MKQSIHIITLGVSDFERSIKFYEQGLGWKKSAASQGDIAFFSMGGINFAIYPKDKLAEDVGIDANGSGFPGFTIAHNARSEEEVDHIFQEVKNLGASIAKEPQKVFWGGYSGYFRDPDGYLFEVAYNPFAKFDENDYLVL